MSEENEFKSQEIFQGAALDPSLIGPTQSAVPPYQLPTGPTGPTGGTGIGITGVRLDPQDLKDLRELPDLKELLNFKKLLDLKVNVHLAIY
ncbi:exosporium leader peptide-containing protein [Bacillus paramobilis]|uniref:exosporium leader peptide-containing protein n=1 Tax=Bacillus paramobilis TaxID=2817477 RepID=UPI0032162438